MSFHTTSTIRPALAVLRVLDLQECLRFYQEVIGLKVLSETEESAELGVESNEPLLRLVQLQGGEERKETAGLYHVAFLVPSRENLADVFMHLLTTGYPLQGASHHEVSEAVYLSDPEGNGIEIYADTPSENWVWRNGQVQMTTKALNAENLLSQKTKSKWEGLPSGTVIGHIHLSVNNLEKAEAFYSALGFQTVSQYADAALFLSHGGYHHHIGINIWNSEGASPAGKKSSGLDYLSIFYPSEKNRREAIYALEELGIALEERKDGIFASDHSGITVQLIIEEKDEENGNI
ncbi:VOC family protein [Metabacillus lacus]|uniref:VOC family protein n=1 Tax=Metabacillus lacus TaxID=1983721 RepID=UPI0012B01AA6